MPSTALKRVVWLVITATWLSTASTVSAEMLPVQNSGDSYAVALHKALMFFNAQKSGKLPENNGIPWRGNSALQDGAKLNDVKGGLVGGYYDSGDNTKFHFPMAFTITMLSWSVIEYPHKYRAINEYNHIRELIKWGTDYLLKTFNTTTFKIDKIYSQVGGASQNSRNPNDMNCWERPEDMDYPRPIQTTYAGPELAAEMAAALASASLVFSDNPQYSNRLIKGAEPLFVFSRDRQKRSRYSRGNPWIEPYYNSTGYFDEYLWGATWLYFATGNNKYLSLATNPSLAKKVLSFKWTRKTSVFSWDNKVLAALMLQTRLRIMIPPSYPYEAMLVEYHKLTDYSMCSFLEPFHLFKRTRGTTNLYYTKPQLSLTSSMPHVTILCDFFPPKPHDDIIHFIIYY